MYVCCKAAEQKKSSNDPLVHKNASYGSSEEISNYITNLGISKVHAKFFPIFIAAMIFFKQWSGFSLGSVVGHWYWNNSRHTGIWWKVRNDNCQW